MAVEQGSGVRKAKTESKIELGEKEKNRLTDCFVSNIDL